MIGMILLISCACLCGIALYSVYGDCDPLKLNLIKKSDQVKITAAFLPAKLAYQIYYYYY